MKRRVITNLASSLFMIYYTALKIGCLYFTSTMVLISYLLFQADQ